MNSAVAILFVKGDAAELYHQRGLNNGHFLFGSYPVSVYYKILNQSYNKELRYLSRIQY